MRVATVVQVLQDLFYVLLHVFSFTCDRSLSGLMGLMQNPSNVVDAFAASRSWGKRRLVSILRTAM